MKTVYAVSVFMDGHPRPTRFLQPVVVVVVVSPEPSPRPCPARSPALHSLPTGELHKEASCTQTKFTAGFRDGRSLALTMVTRDASAVSAAFCKARGPFHVLMSTGQYRKQVPGRIEIGAIGTN
ncbi:hypothetical protein MPTK1_6g20030 [Marchantia polymorpha subsp. ruderalis]|uniref:Uncharacterized protein n=2 Tax=Marchantia polymorpha TaxID=3197 RepID=A0AAF6BU08_MARPO|nr:hypothetical protein MARPO_0045s0060 [Marchantia polymorpha]BBN15492.1 hypothetical protein Mp_6g20030 [Marchantia polymorpha subsp. ruderalis]|eukprot:PTQ39396.1 hypothetical protein MARPO_0045s0060 [Marchantia polymorpha]